MPVKYTDDKITINGIDLYRLEPQDEDPRIGNNVYAAKTAIISDWAIIGDGARIGNWAVIDNIISIGDEVSIGDGAVISDWASIGNRASIGRWAVIGAGTRIGDEVSISRWTRIGNWATIGDRVIIGDGAIIGSWAVIGNEANIGRYDFLLVGPIGSRNTYTSFWRHKDGGYKVCCEGFEGTLAEFEAQVDEVHRDDQHGRAYRAVIAMARACLNDCE